MAIPAQGLTFTWGNATLLEVQEFDVAQANQTVTEPGFGRESGIQISRLAGELRLSSLSMVGLKPVDIGRVRKLRVTVPTGPTSQLVLWDGAAQYAGQTVSAATNGAVRFAHRFTLLSVSSLAGTVENTGGGGNEIP